MQDFNNPIFICSIAKDFLERSSIGAKEQQIILYIAKDFFE
jgi:hypothetical protein